MNTQSNKDMVEKSISEILQAKSRIIATMDELCRDSNDSEIAIMYLEVLDLLSKSSSRIIQIGNKL